jgi:hypothetical protein
MHAKEICLQYRLPSEGVLLLGHGFLAFVCTSVQRETLDVCMPRCCATRHITYFHLLPKVLIIMVIMIHYGHLHHLIDKICRAC